MKKKVLAVILARGGSKGIPHKNLIDLNGKPLLYYAISEAKKSLLIDHIVVSSDSNKILEYAKSQKVLTIKRPARLATDTTISEESLKHAVEKVLSKNIIVDYVLLLQPTSPLRKTTHITESIKKILSEPKMNSLVSLCKSPKNHCLYKKIDRNGFVQPIFNKLEKSLYPSSRQNIKNIYYINGAIYIVKKECFLKTGSLYNDKMGYYLMDRTSSMDIDEPLDLGIANYLLNKEIECQK